MSNFAQALMGAPALVSWLVQQGIKAKAAATQPSAAAVTVPSAFAATAFLIAASADDPAAAGVYEPTDEFVAALLQRMNDGGTSCFIRRIDGNRG